MLELQQLILIDVKRFEGTNNVDFSNTEAKLISLSGNNGSGKTTILHSLMVAQMVYFIKENNLEIKYPELVQKCNCNDKVFQLLTKEKSQIKIKFRSDENDCGFTLSVKSLQEKTWEIKYDSPKSQELIGKYWNLTDPSCLFFYLGSDKHYSEESVTYEKIKISTKDNQSYLLDYILDYSHFSENMYQTLMNDYIRERVIPGNPRHDIYFGAAKILFNNLFPNANIKNFSGIKKSEFQLMVKNEKSGTGLFDVRLLSSGEKTILYLCLLLSYFTNIGLLLIDEPENHLHEKLLNELMIMLKKITESQSYAEVLQNYQKGSLKKYIKDYYTNYKLQKVVFVTHSKYLIYSNFQFGQNFIVDKKVRQLNFDDAEKELREEGLSSIFEKILIVEGKTENQLLYQILGDSGVHIYPIIGCSQVLNLYNKIRLLKNHLHSVKFVFMIDSDTKNKNKFDKVREEDPSFYDSHFVLLNKHEIENYFIDIKLLKDVCDEHNLNSNETVSQKDLQTMIEKEVEETKELVKQKALNEKLHDYIVDLAEKVKQRDILVSSKASFESYIKPIFEDIHQDYFNDVMSIFSEVNSKYENWGNDKYNLCDGKKAYGILKSKIADKLDVKPNRIDNSIYKLLQQDVYSSKPPKYELTTIIKDIQKKLEL